VTLDQKANMLYKV